MIIIYTLGSAAFYVLSTYAMKFWNQLGLPMASFFIIATLAVAVVLETLALREARLAYTFILILGFECIIALASAWFFLRESYAPVEALGIALIIIGVALTHAAPEKVAV